ncbi:MAG TPA: nitroreductase family protein [Acidobacteriaceae bacterium]|nr:nitroreductase family protein [Acidobacteriaceae bacterium]
MQQTLKLIRDRYSERGAFDAKRPVAKADLKMILEAARWAPTPTNMQNFEIVVVDDTQQLEAIGKIPAYMSENFLRENYAELVSTEEELRIRKRGMLASLFPAAWTDPQAWDEDSDARFQLTFLERAVQENPLLLVVLYDGSKRAPGSERDLPGHMSLGCVMENMWLMAEALGIGFRVLTVFSDSPVEREVKKVLRTPSNMKVAFACALGYPVQPSRETYLRVRRDMEDFVHANEFGRRDPELKSEAQDIP